MLATAASGRAPRTARVLLLAGSDLAARRIDPSGLQPLATTPSGDLDVQVSVEPDVVTAATGAASWTALNLLVDAAARAARLAAPLRAAVVGLGIYAADVAVSQAHEHAEVAEVAEMDV